MTLYYPREVFEWAFVEPAKSVEKKKLTEEKKSRALKRMSFTSEFDDLSECDFIIEAALENIDLKKDIFGRLDKNCREDAILSTNTSFAL